LVKRISLSAVGAISAAVISVAVLSLIVVATLARAPRLTVDATGWSSSPQPVTNASVFELPVHTDEITVRGTAEERSTVSIWLDNVLEASGYLVPGTTTFAFTHVPVPSAGWNAVRVEAATWHGVRRVTTSVQFGLVNPPFAPSKIDFDARRYADSSDVVLTGSAAPQQAIVIYDSSPAKPSATPRPDARVVAQLRTGSTGTFRRIVSLPTGTHILWAATLGCAAARCTSMAHDPVTIDHSAPPPAALQTKRSMRLRFDYEQLAIDVDATVPRDDPIFDQLLQGATADAVVAALYGDLLINGQRVDAMFQDVTPSFALTNNVVRVKFTSGQPLPPGTLPFSSGRVLIVDHPQAYQTKEWSSDLLTVSGGGYLLDHEQRAPDLTQKDGAVTWDHPFQADGDRVGMTLSVASWRRSSVIRDFLSLSIFALLPDVVARLVSVAGGLIFAIPMLAYLALAARRPAPLRLAARVATAVCVSPQVFLAVAAVQPAVDDALNRMLGGSSAVLTGVVGAVVCTLTLTAVAGFVAYLANRWSPHWWAVVVREASYGVMLAGGFFAVASAVSYVVDAVAPTVRYTTDWRYLAGVALSITVVATCALAYSGFYRTPNGRLSVVHVLVTATIVLLEALPLTFGKYVEASPGLNILQAPFSQYIESAGEATFNGTALASLGSYAGLVFDYLRQASILSDFTFGLALIWTWNARSGNGLEAEELLRIILCCYAVAATASFFLIPVTFIIAWLTFRTILNPSPPPPARRDEVIKKRKTLVQRLLYGTTSDDLIAELQDVEDQHTLKKTDDKTFAAQRDALELALGERIATVRDVFGVAPAGKPAYIGAWVGAVFVVAHVLLFLGSQTAGFRVTHTAFPLLVLASYISTGAAQFIGPAFVFGACYELIRGRSGLQKALVVAAWVIACSLPSWWLRLPNLASVGAIAVETALFYAVLGITFDVVIAREGAGVRFRFRDLPRLSGLPALGWAGSIIVAALGVALSGLITHQFQDVVASTITSVYHQAALGP
jgi:hypothetical protein